MQSGTGARLRALRIRAGWSKADVVRRMGLNAAWYEDLEEIDGELAATLTLFQAMELAALLGVSLPEMLDAATASPNRLPLLELPQRIRAHVARVGISLDAFEATLGWALTELMESPLQAAATLPLAWLQSLAQALDIDWTSLIPGPED